MKDARARESAALVVAGALLWSALVLSALLVDDSAAERSVDLLGLLLLPAVLLPVFRRSSDALGRRVRRAEQQLAVVASAGDALLWECDARGVLTYASDNVAEHFGYAVEEVRGLALRDVVHPQEHERLAGLLAAGSGWHQERWRCLAKDGSERWFAGSAAPEHATDGALVGFTGSAHRLGHDEVDEHRLSALATDVYARLAPGRLTTLFQPIVSVASGRLLGAEALTRFPGSARGPEQWFADAAEVGLAVELDLAAVRNALAAADEVPSDVYVSFNVAPATLVRPALLDVLRAGPLPLDRVVLEVTEHACITDYEAVQAALRPLREAGIRLAVDDAGAGYASFRHILRLSPHCIKLDRSIVAGLHEHRGRRALAAAIATFGSEMDAVIVAEGVETQEELQCLQSLGIDAAQGYLLGRPAGDWSAWRERHRHGPLHRLSAVPSPRGRGSRTG